jgi:hypothetical protein
MTDYLHEGDPDWGWEFRCEDFVFARLNELRDSAEELAGPARQAVLNRADGLRRIAGWHSTYVDDEGRSRARCFTCDASFGFPCVTMRALATMWRTHEGFLPGWGHEGDAFIADAIEMGGFRNAYLAKKAAS